MKFRENRYHAVSRGLQVDYPYYFSPYISPNPVNYPNKLYLRDVRYFSLQES